MLFFLVYSSLIGFFGPSSQFLHFKEVENRSCE
jgi:hypothetical protein